MKLPNGEQASIPDMKLKTYLLDKTHPRTKAKLRFMN